MCNNDVSSIFFVGGLEKYLVSHYRRQRAPETERQHGVGWRDIHSTHRDVVATIGWVWHAWYKCPEGVELTELAHIGQHGRDFRARSYMLEM